MFLEGRALGTPRDPPVPETRLKPHPTELQVDSSLSGGVVQLPVRNFLQRDPLYISVSPHKRSTSSSLYPAIGKRRPTSVLKKSMRKVNTKKNKS